ncbi:hypothetical protein [Primorskyibacter marinus]|uniref:hypothetical protein n=1 Tax=Primorskyibacter marinus TaxID=1977320 RepID=UPI000E30491D|nr:hypothetical protein [Primorskyibacter marinus]
MHDAQQHTLSESSPQVRGVIRCILRATPYRKDAAKMVFAPCIKMLNIGPTGGGQLAALNKSAKPGDLFKMAVAGYSSAPPRAESHVLPPNES